MIEIKARDLYKAVKSVKLTKTSKLPILNHVLIELRDGGLIVAMRDLDEDKPRISEPVQYWSDGERWATCVPGIRADKEFSNYDRKTHTYKRYPFLDWLRVMAEDNSTLQVEFDSDLFLLTFYSGRSTTVFYCMDA